jgi:hypothetical protein
MNQVIAWAGFAGAWLLVAGPLYQGAIELAEEEVDREAIEASTAGLPRPEPPSPWWWLLPPVMYLIRRRSGRAFRRAALARLTQVQRAQFTRFISKAAGWFTVALGAALLAAEQTWQITIRYRWPDWLFWVLIVVMLAACVLNTAVRMISYDRMTRSEAQPADAVAGQPGDDLSHAPDLVGLDSDQQSLLATAAVPGIRAAEVTLGQLLDMVGRPVRGHVQDTTANREVPGRVVRIGDGQGDTRVTVDIQYLLEPRDAVDQDVLAVGIDPGLSQLRRTVGHQGRQVTRAGLMEQGEQAAGQIHVRVLL